ncbi:hypothetical protein Zmor_015526 [Zophobas morio]|uniref:Peptidase S1 domain-containing protein n=1 Tax=Zophobas morio TaxID=2755281 RepID=A0AA38IKD0_9CUCU|nr:hypothetical protein Zmor_015526 [Zophobas morio]
MKLLLGLVLCVALVCARQAPSLTREGPGVRIIGGNDAVVGQFPFIAALNIQTEDSTFFCGGALISNEWVLTSAHCTQGAHTVTIRLGSNKLTGSDPNRVILASSHVVVHPDFDPDTSANDVGLIRLRLPVEFTDYIQPIRLAGSHLPNSASPTALGWGQTSDEDPEFANDLQFVALAVVSNEECAVTYGKQITNNILCVDGNYNEGTCYGDSGSPLVVRMVGGSALQHVGISSFFSGNGCESTDPSGYTRTWPYVDWIRNETGM